MTLLEVIIAVSIFSITAIVLLQWVLREAYIKWTGEGLSRDLRTISLDEGSYILLDLGEDYSGAIWSQDPLELQWEHADVQLP